MLAGAGQKTITANIIPQPWGPTHTYYEDPDSNHLDQEKRWSMVF